MNTSEHIAAYEAGLLHHAMPCEVCGKPRSKHSFGYGKCASCFVATAKPKKVHIHDEVYEAEWRARIKEPNIEKLTEEVIRPADDLLPLFLFRGTKSSCIKRNWNFSVAMMLSEVSSFSDGVKLSRIGETAHMCGKHGLFERHPLKSFFSRMWYHPKVTDRIPGMTEYVRWLLPKPYPLIAVPLVKKRMHWRDAPWHEYEKKAPRMWRPPSHDLHVCYPFCGNADSDSLVSRVHSMVPKGISADIRGDLCQDLLVSVLSGGLALENVPDAIAKHLRHARKFLPASSRILSLDAPLYGDTDRTMHDMIGG